MRINFEKAEGLKEVVIAKNDNNTYSILINGEDFNFNCNESKNINLSFDILKDTTIKTIERK